MSMLQATGSKNALSENGFESGDAHPAYASQCAVHAAWCCVHAMHVSKQMYCLLRFPVF